MWDVFISHASEDKDEIARPLADALVKAGFRVWFDEYALNLGDSLNRSINHGLAQARFGIVILSPAFFAKEWPQRELDGLTSREIGGGKVILPVWHKVDRADVARFSPILADKLGVSTTHGLAVVVHDVLQVLQDRPVLQQPKPARGRMTKRTKVLAATWGLAILAGGGWVYVDKIGPAYARARIEAWPMDYSTARFIERAGQGDLAAVKLFLAAGIDPNQADDDTALMAAAREGHLEVIKALLAGGANVNKWSKGYHPLMAAAESGQLSAARMLLDEGAEPDAVDRALESASAGGNPDVLRALYEHGARLTVDDGVRALHDAAFRGHDAAIGVLLDRGVDVNGKDGEGYTALKAAVRDDRIETAKLLLERGANIDIRDKDGLTPLMWVTSHEETARFLIEQGADIHAKDDQGVTVLQHAISQVPFGARPIVDLLLAKNVDVNLPANDGETPLMVAARASQSVDIVAQLLDMGVKVNAKDRRGYTALMLALQHRGYWTIDAYAEALQNIVKTLLQGGADVGIRADDGETALSLAKQLPKVYQKTFVNILQSKPRR